MRAPSGRARATALPTTSTERSEPSMGTSRWRYTEDSSMNPAMLARPSVRGPPRAGGALYHRPAPFSDETSQQPAVNDLATPSSAAVGAAHDLLLKVTAPRVPRHQIARQRLQATGEAYRDRPVILVQAPAGYGKTSLLAQWRREHLAHGAVVAWLSVQA